MLLSLFNLALAIWNTVFRGLIIKIFWAWFVITLIPTLPALTVVTAIGLCYIVGAFKTLPALTREQLDKIKSGEGYTNTNDNASLGIWNGVIHSVSLLAVLGGG